MFAVSLKIANMIPQKPRKIKHAPIAQLDRVTDFESELGNLNRVELRLFDPSNPCKIKV